MARKECQDCAWFENAGGGYCKKTRNKVSPRDSLADNCNEFRYY